VIAIDSSKINTEGAKQQTKNISASLDKVYGRGTKREEMEHGKGREGKGEKSGKEGVEGKEEILQNPKISHVETFVNTETDLISLLENKHSSRDIAEKKLPESGEIGAPEGLHDSESYFEGSPYIGEKKFGLVGLHCCGDLTPTLLRIFCATPQVKCLLVVGCCYYGMREEGKEEDKREGKSEAHYEGREVGEFVGEEGEGGKTRAEQVRKKILRNFPMSRRIRNLGGNSVITEGGLKVACDHGEDNGGQEFVPVLGAPEVLVQKGELSALYRIVLDKLLYRGHKEGILLPTLPNPSPLLHPTTKNSHYTIYLLPFALSCFNILTINSHN
jgi:hypothetical protein